jgi:hypothetical protein
MYVRDLDDMEISQTHFILPEFRGGCNKRKALRNVGFRGLYAVPN